MGEQFICSSFYANFPPDESVSLRTVLYDCHSVQTLSTTPMPSWHGCINFQVTRADVHGSVNYNEIYWVLKVYGAIHGSANINRPFQADPNHSTILPQNFYVHSPGLRWAIRANTSIFAEMRFDSRELSFATATTDLIAHLNRICIMLTAHSAFVLLGNIEGLST